MARYDDLRSAFRKHQQDARESSLRRQDLLATLASGFRTFLGCPKSFLDPRSGVERLYVTPLAVDWREGRFVVNRAIPTGVRPHVDGRFYFCLCVYLETGENEHPKRPFGILLSALTHAGDTEIRIEDTDPKFSVHLEDPDGLRDFYGEIFGVVEDGLASESDGPRPQIGFIDADV